MRFPLATWLNLLLCMVCSIVSTYLIQPLARLAARLRSKKRARSLTRASTRSVRAAFVARALTTFLLAMLASTVWTSVAQAQLATLNDVANVVFYSRPDQLGLTNGATVTTDTDFSAGGTFSGTPVGSFTYDSVKKAFYFDSSQTQYITRDSVAAAVFHGTNKPYAYFALVQLEKVQLGSSGIPYQCVSIVANITGSTNVTRDFLIAFPNNEMMYSDARSDSAVIKSLGSGTAPDVQTHCMGWTFDGTYAYLWLDGVKVCKALSDVGTFTLNVAGCYTESAHRRVDGITSFFNGWLGERAMWSRCLTDTECGQVSAYLMAKAGIVNKPPFDALQIAGAGSRWRIDSAKSANAIADGASITLWPGQGFGVGGTTDMTYNEGGTSLYTLNVQNNLPMVTTNGHYFQPGSYSAPGSQYLANGTPSFSWYGCFKAKALTTEQDLSSLSASSGGAYFRFGINSSGAYQVVQRNSAGTVTTVTGGTADFNLHLWQLTFNGSTVTVWIDGVKVITNGALSGGVMRIDYYLPSGGSYVSSVNQFAWVGWLGEFGCFPLTALSDSDIAKVLAYDRNYWGIFTSAASTGRGRFLH